MLKVTVGHCEDIVTADATQDVLALCERDLGDDIPLIGLSSCGELCPLEGQQRTESHDMTFITIFFGES